jgi:alanine dehydrogenase
MIVGVPKEIKEREYRVANMPGAFARTAAHGLPFSEPILSRE